MLLHTSYQRRRGRRTGFYVLGENASDYATAGTRSASIRLNVPNLDPYSHVSIDHSGEDHDAHFLLRFADLSKIPANEEIVDTAIVLTHSETTVFTGLVNNSLTAQMYRVLVPWRAAQDIADGENSVNWINRITQDYGSTLFPWDLPGGKSPGWDRSSELSIEFQIPSAVPGDTVVIQGPQITDDVVVWRETPSANNGWFVVVDPSLGAGTGSFAKFLAEEATNEAEPLVTDAINKRPRLYVWTQEVL